MSTEGTHHPSRGTAVVIGGSMAGLTAAAVLAPRFASVTIVERDVLPGGPADRRGVPQGRHAHGLLPAGLVRLEGWFPGLTQELVDAGAVYADLGLDAAWYQGGGHRARFATGKRGPIASRALLEHHVRRRTLALANVALRAGAGVSGLTATADGATVTGVTLDDGTSIAADLVVDASGRGGHSLRWLGDLGYEAPPTTHITIDVAYSTRVFRLDTPPEWKLGWSWPARPPAARGWPSPSRATAGW